MNKLYEVLSDYLRQFFKENFEEAEIKEFLFQPTNKDHQGNLTLMVFPLAKSVKIKP